MCSVDGCEKVSVSRGLCPMHYRRFRLYGDPNAKRQEQLHGATIRDRFEHYVVKGDGCWSWSGSTDQNGYGKLNVHGIPALAHRLSWTFHCGPIPDGQQVLHKCDNPICSNPDHLFIGDHQDNMTDMWMKGRANPKIHLGVEHGMAKLTEDQVYKIRESSGASRIIAAELGISGRQVRDIRNRKSWSHLPERNPSNA
jgi:hypothetical protein